MDYFRRMLAHFGWTWLERVHRRRKDRAPTALADYELSRVEWTEFDDDDEDWQWWCEFQAQRTIDEFRWN